MHSWSRRSWVHQITLSSPLLPPSLLFSSEGSSVVSASTFSSWSNKNTTLQVAIKLTWTKRGTPLLLLQAAFQLSCCGVHPVWLASGGRPSVLFISIPLAPQIPSLGCSESCRFWQPLGTGVCCSPKEQEEHWVVERPGSSAWAALGELSSNWPKKKGIFNVFILEWIWRGVFLLAVVVGGFFVQILGLLAQQKLITKDDG